MKPSEDKLFKIKYMGFCMAQMPPEDVASDFADFVRYAKFQLSVDKCVLMEDPMWDKYTDEQILVEYFANLFMKSKEERERFEGQFKGEDPDLYDWFDRKIAENKKELEAKAADLEDSVSFKPDSLGD